MFELLPETYGRYVAIKASGRLTDADYRSFVPKLEALIRERGPIRLLVDLSEFEGWTPRAAWDDFTFGLRHRRDFERIALVGDKTWEGLAARLARAVMTAEVRRFATRDRQIAWDYILDLG